MTAVGDARTRLDTIDGLLVDAEGAITRAQDILRRVLHVDEADAAVIVRAAARANVGAVIGLSDVIPGNVSEVIDRDRRKWVRDGALFLYAGVARSSVTLTDSVGPVTVTKISDEPETGEWVTVRPDDPRIVDGSRVRLGGVAGAASCLATSLACHVDVRSPSAWVVRNTNGPDIELLVPAEVALPLPTEPGVFWGRVKCNGETYVGWVLVVFALQVATWYCTPVRVGKAFWHTADRVARIPVPDAEREALR